MTNYEVKSFQVENIVAGAKARVPINLMSIVKSNPWIKYQPESFPAAGLYLSGRRRVQFFSNGRISIYSPTEDGIKTSLDYAKTVLKDAGQVGATAIGGYEIYNVVATAALNDGMECGLLKAIFPDSKKAFGEGVRVKTESGVVSIFPSGKVAMTGFKSIDEARATLNGIVGKINSEIDNIDADKATFCAIERGEPLIRKFYEYLEKISPYGFKLSDSERLEGRRHLDALLKKMSTKKGNMGATVEVLAAGEIYILSVLFNKKLTQIEVAEFTGMTEGTVRSGYKKIRNELKGSEFELFS